VSLADPAFPRPGRVTAAPALGGEIEVPADKSIAHRALLFNAMASGTADVTVRRPGGDTRSTAGALAALGALERGTERRDGTIGYHIHGGGTRGAAGLPGTGAERLDCENSGTTMRLLAGALAGRAGRAAVLVGDASLSRRPMERIAGPLRRMGATVTTTDGHAPLGVTGVRPLRALDHRLLVASAQVLGAITLAALSAEGTTTIESPGPTRDHTERLLAWLGANVRREGRTTTVVGPNGMRARSLTVPGDISSAAAWLVAAAIHPDAEVRLPGVGLNPSRMAIVDALREMGADIEVASATGGGGQHAGPEPVGDLLVRGGRRLRGISLSGPRVAELIDELPLLAVAMAAAQGTSELRDAAELRVKESDRIALVVRNLVAIGATADELPDGWRVTAGRARPAEIESLGDHRIAIAFAVAALSGTAGEVTIDDPECVGVSYPGFWDDLEAVSGDRTRPRSAGARR
jgi:3-phosphoshikimate 1-carboxyvinyltransferase